MHCIKNRWGFGFYLLRLLHSLSVGTLIGTPRVQSRRFISYSWLDFIYEGPGTQLAAKLSWSTFLETTALFSCVLYLSLETGLDSTSGLKVPSEQGSLLCSVLRVVRFQWNQKLLKAACYDFFFPRNLYRFFAACCSVTNYPQINTYIGINISTVSQICTFH